MQLFKLIFRLMLPLFTGIVFLIVECVEYTNQGHVKSLKQNEINLIHAVNITWNIGY